MQGSPDRTDPHACYVSTLIFVDGTTLDRYGQRIEAQPTTQRAARTASGEPNIAGDWAQEQLVMTDPKGRNGTLVPLSKSTEFGVGGVPEGQREIAGARGTAEANTGGLPSNRPPPRAAVALKRRGQGRDGQARCDAARDALVPAGQHLVRLGRRGRQPDHAGEADRSCSTTAFSASSA